MPPKQIDLPIFDTAYFDMYDGARHALVRLRQLSTILQGNADANLWPLAVVNAATCLEWFARTAVKQLIDYSADKLNPNATLLRELKINYSLILRAHANQFSIGDIVATSRNFSSFSDIHQTIEDLIRNPNSVLLDKIKSALQHSPYNRRRMAALNRMFDKRNELVHGSPRYLSYDDDLGSYLTKRELLSFIFFSIEYIRTMDITLRRHIPQLGERSTLDTRLNQATRLYNSEQQLDKITKAVETRISGQELIDFRKAQRAWRLWRDRESRLQAADWAGGTGWHAVQMGYDTSFNMHRIRSLETYLRKISEASYR